MLSRSMHIYMRSSLWFFEQGYSGRSCSSEELLMTHDFFSVHDHRLLILKREATLCFFSDTGSNISKNLLIMGDCEASAHGGKRQRKEVW
jgi:hypothetical protein